MGSASRCWRYLTELGITTEELAKWHELDSYLSRFGGHVNPEIADALGIRILLFGAVFTAIGFVLARGQKAPTVGARR